MKAFTGLALLCLVFSVSPTPAGEEADGRPESVASVSADELVRVSTAHLARLRREAAKRVGSLSGRGPESGALVGAIRAETDPAAREAQWSAWLDRLAGSGVVQPHQVQALVELKTRAPVVGIPHHEFPSRTMPAFAVAARAEVLLARHARASRARKLARRPGELAEALESVPGSPAFEAGLEALHLVSPALLANLVDPYRQHAPFSAAASRILLEAAEAAPEQLHLLPEIIRLGDAGTARRALRLAIDRGLPQLGGIADAALSRRELGGLSLIAARQSGMHPDRFCWPLLGDPSFGADAARMLAAESDRLTEEISARVAEASGLARLRMLLALRMRDTEASRALLAELAEAPWLTEQQRREVRSWR
ncbi:MAG: hypothetical protein CMP07_07675 [Xanthomonadales bacterium]|nr:hypothetical protein [Ahrensia sp.]MBL38274.1 hypothetical protein [Xanthomonadales bacterium]